MSELTIYTGIFGDGDRLYEPRSTENLRFVCYTDNENIKSDIWEVRYQSPQYAEHPRWQARRCKILGYKELDAQESLWIDGRYEFVRLIRLPIYNNILLNTHYERNCAYDEARICIDNGIGNAKDLMLSIDRMHNSGFPHNYGLWYTSNLWRRHTVETEILCESWWQEMSQGSIRDQVSLPFVLWKTGIKYTSHQFASDINNFSSFVELIGHEHLYLDMCSNGNRWYN